MTTILNKDSEFHKFVQSLKVLELTSDEKSRLVAHYMDTNTSGKNDTLKSYSILRSVFAVIFLLGYFGLMFLLVMKFLNGVTIAPDAMNLVFAIWGAMSAKLNTVTDYIFGGSIASTQKPKYNSKTATKKTT